MNKIIKGIMNACALILLLANEVAAQDAETSLFRKEGKIYVVIGIMLLILSGLTAYLIHIERRTKKLEDQIKKGRS